MPSNQPFQLNEENTLKACIHEIIESTTNPGSIGCPLLIQKENQPKELVILIETDIQQDFLLQEIQDTITATLKNAQYFRQFRTLFVSPGSLPRKSFNDKDSYSSITKSIDHSADINENACKQLYLNNSLAFKNSPASSYALLCGGILFNTSAPQTLVDAFKNIETIKDRGITWIPIPGTETHQSYADFYLQACKIYRGLKENNFKPGDNVILQINDRLDYLATFWACIIGGVRPVSIVTPDFYEKNPIVDKIFKAWNLLGKPLIITDANSAEKVKRIPALYLGNNAPEMRIIAVEKLKIHKPLFKFDKIEPTDIAFLQLSSGSTGDPKAIMLSHRNLIHQILASIHFLQYKTTDKFLAWQPIDHAIHFILQIMPVLLGAQQNHVATSIVVANPDKLFELAAKLKVTHTASPNFGFNLIYQFLKKNEKPSWDLSALKFIINSAEPILFATMRQLLSHINLPILPAWGMTELSSAVTYERNFLSTHSRIFIASETLAILPESSNTDTMIHDYVSVGEIIAGVNVRVVDENDDPLSLGRIGRIQIKGTVVTPGYFNNPEANKKAFTKDGWFNTGDLGLIIHNRLFVTGREKELVIIHGVHYNCYAIENFCTLEDVEPTFIAVVGISNKQRATEDMVIFFVPKQISGANLATEDIAKIALTIKANVYNQYRINPIVVPLLKAQFPKTISGKIQREILKNNYLNKQYLSILDNIEQIQLTQQLETFKLSTRAEAIEDILINICRTILQEKYSKISTNINANTILSRLGFDSLDIAVFRYTLENALNITMRTFELAFLLQDKSIASFAEHLYQYAAMHSLQLSPKKPEPKPQSGFNQASPYQESLWIFNQQTENDSIYNIPLVLEMKGAVDAQKIEIALNKIIERHEPLRTCYMQNQSDLIQDVSDDTRIQEIHTLKMQSEVNYNKEFIQKYIQGLLTTPFDLAKGPLLRSRLVRFSDNLYIWILIIHHIIFDGHSIDIFFNEFFHLYFDQEIRLSKIDFTYSNYAHAQKQWLMKNQQEILNKKIDWWKKSLAPFDALSLSAVTDNETTPALNKKFPIFIESSLYQKLIDRCAQYNVTLYMFLLASFQCLLHRYFRQDHFTVGCPANIRQPEVQNLIGYFINMIAVPADLSGNPTFPELLKRVREHLLGCYLHGDAPFPEVVKAIPRSRDGMRNPLFSTFFGLQQAHPLPKSDQTTNIDFSLVNLDFLETEADPFIDLGVQLFHFSTGIRGRVTYNSNSFTDQSIKFFAKYWLLFLDKIVTNPEIKIGELSLINDEEIKYYQAQSNIVEFSKTLRPVHELFEKHVNINPNSKIISPSMNITYVQLNRMANQIAHTLLINNAKPGDKVVIICDEGIYRVTAMLASCKANMVFTCLDQEATAKLKYFQAQFLVTDLDNEIFSNNIESKIINLNSAFFKTQNNTENLNLTISLNSDAYWISTSGTTGEPKWPVLSHYTLSVWSKEKGSTLNINSSTNVLSFSKPNFDASLAEILCAALSNGANLILVDQAIRTDAVALNNYINEHKITLAFLTRTVLAYIDPKRDYPKIFILIGEILLKKLIALFISAGKIIYNAYGPTEGGIGVSWGKILDLQLPITIGRCIRGKALIIIDQYGNLCPAEIPGEICIGLGIIQRYLNTEIKPPLFSFNDIPYYRTGDLGKYLINGEIQFLGRIDNHQEIKFNAIRIQLSAIEACLQELTEIQSAVVVYNQKKSELLAFIIVEPNVSAPTPPQLFRHLCSRLNISSLLIKFKRLSNLSELPTTAAGKINRNALAAMNIENDWPDRTPKSELELQVAEIWRDFLPQKDLIITMEANFFMMGGNSLISISVMSKIAEKFKITLPRLFLLRNPTLQLCVEEIMAIKANQSKSASNQYGLTNTVWSTPPKNTTSPKNTSPSKIEQTHAISARISCNL